MNVRTPERDLGYVRAGADSGAWASALRGTALAVIVAAGALAFVADRAVAQDTSIPVLPLDEALGRFAESYGWQLSYSSDLVRSLNSQPVQGPMTGEAALRTLLGGSGLEVVVTGPNSAAITAPAQTSGALPGDLQLGAVNVTATASNSALWDGSAESVYATAGSVLVIETQQLETFRGGAPSDLLRSATGVISAEARNSGGLDVNIRGLQGPRVAVTVDDTMNSTTLYRAYQGMSNRTYVDPDFIAGVSVDRGPGASPGAIGGTVAMSTYDVDDLVAEGGTFGIRYRLEFSGNATVPRGFGTGSLGSYNSGNETTSSNGAIPDAPDFGGLATTVMLGYRAEAFDVMLGLSRRYSGNYHAGSTGDSAPQAIDCPYEPEVCAANPDRAFFTPGLTGYLPGEEVLNTSFDNQSMIGKINWQVNDAHRLTFGFSTYESLHGETHPWQAWNNTHGFSEGMRSSTELFSRYLTWRFSPESDLVELKATAWSTDMNTVNPSSNGGESRTIGGQWGLELTNNSRVEIAGTELLLTYGLTYGHEETRPDPAIYEPYPQRWGRRDTAGLFVNGRWIANDWLNLTAGLRRHTFEVQDDRPPYDPANPPVQGQTDGWATDLSFGIEAQITDSLQLFATYDRATRLPSMFEAIGGLATTVADDLTGETGRSIEIGANVQRDGLFAEDDRLGVKLALFRNEVENYIYRTNEQYCAYWWNGRCYYWAPNLHLGNIDSMNVQGAELQADYRNGSFAARLGATYYSRIEFCPTEDTCRESTLGADYATNQIPPEYALTLDVSQRFLEDRLGLAARVSRIGGRPIAADPTSSGAQPFIAVVEWEPYTTIDLHADYRLGNGLSVYVSAENIADTYYAEPMSLALLPSPGRTLRIGLTAAIGGPAGQDSTGAAPATTDWSGFYLGATGSATHLTNVLRDYTYGVQTNIVEPGRDSIAGLRFGWNHAVSDGFVLGVMADVQRGSSQVGAVYYRGETTLDLAVSDAVTLAVRAGVTTGNFLVYGMLGVASADVRSSERLYNDYGPDWGVQDMTFGHRERVTGLVAGFGTEYAFAGNWSVFGEYQHSSFGDGIAWQDTQYDAVFDQELTRGRGEEFAIDQIRVGVNYRF